MYLTLSLRHGARPRQSKLFFYCFNTHNTGALKAICVMKEPYMEENGDKVQELQTAETVGAPEQKNKERQQCNTHANVHK